MRAAPSSQGAELNRQSATDTITKTAQIINTRPSIGAYAATLKFTQDTQDSLFRSTIVSLIHVQTKTTANRVTPAHNRHYVRSVTP